MPFSSMDLSIITVTRNTRDATCAAIRSVYAPDDSLMKEIIVVDNGSIDGTMPAIEEQFPSVQLLRMERNLGFARACNVAARKATGEFLLLLNSDAEVEPEILPAAVNAMRTNPKCGVAGAKLLNPDGTPQNSIANFPTLATELLNKSLLRLVFPRRFPGKERKFERPVAVESVVGAFFLTRRSVWDELGGLDERFFFFFEETDYCRQARLRGWEVLHLPFVRVWHEQGKSARQWNIAARVEYWRSRYAYFQKNHSAGTVRFLRWGLRARLLADLIGAFTMTALTFGLSEGWRERLRLRQTLWDWHARGCPPGEGLPR